LIPAGFQNILKQVRVWFTILLSTCYAVAGPQPAPEPESTAGIFGRVVNAETHEAVRRAVIKIYTAKDQWYVFTDGAGRFTFPSLVPGEYNLIAHRDGYTDRAYKVEQSDFDARKELPIELRPQGVITGKAVDGSGQALQSAQIEALGSGIPGGNIQVVSSAATNDLAEFRLSGLDPGTYRLRATYREGGRSIEFDSTPLTTATSYYGGSEKPAEIIVQASSVTTGIDFVLNAVRPVTVRGTLHTENGVMTERAILMIMGTAGEGGHNGDAKEGKFELGDLGPGIYTISAETLNKTAPLFGMSTVQVRGEDVDGVDLVMRPIPKIEGEIRIEDKDPADLKVASVYFIRNPPVTMMTVEIGHPDKDRKFTLALIPGEYIFSIDTSANKLAVRSVTLDDKPITDGKLHIDISPEPRKLVIVLGSKSKP
jgi:hypothetical protein